MSLNFEENVTKELVFNEVSHFLKQKNIECCEINNIKPWGGYFVVEETSTQQFIDAFYPEYKIADVMKGNKISPKILVVAPEKRLSWQYHFRRAEIWKVIGGNAGVVTSYTDHEGELQVLEPGEKIELQQGERHRLVGLRSWGIISEIWQHTDVNNPSNEADIIRLQDDFGR